MNEWMNEYMNEWIHRMNSVLPVLGLKLWEIGLIGTKRFNGRLFQIVENKKLAYFKQWFLSLLFYLIM